MPIGLVYTFQDAKGAKGTTTINIPDATAYADALEFASALAQLFANMTTGRLMAVGIHISVDVSGLASNTLGANSDVEEGAKFSWLTVGDFRASNRIPTFDEALIVAASKQVDVTDADVAQFVSYMTDGFTATSTNVVLPVDYRNADINDLISALEDFVTSRKMRLV
jgi:hypothetical protein